MEKKTPSEGLAAVWERVEAARPRLEGSAALMPRKKKKRPPLRPFPEDATFSAGRG